MDKEQASEVVRCKFCEKTKPLHAFRPSKDMLHKHKCDWACLDCEFPTCASTSCNARPDKAQTTQGWMCEKCRYPPCITCGKKRPHRSHHKDNSVTAKPTWRCATCTLGIALQSIQQRSNHFNELHDAADICVHDSLLGTPVRDDCTDITAQSKMC